MWRSARSTSGREQASTGCRAGRRGPVMADFGKQRPISGETLSAPSSGIHRRSSFPPQISKGIYRITHGLVLRRLDLTCKNATSCNDLQEAAENHALGRCDRFTPCEMSILAIRRSVREHGRLSLCSTLSLVLLNECGPHRHAP